MQTATDAELILAIRKGTITAFEQLVIRYQRGVVAFAARIVRNEKTAEEIAQDAFFRVYKTIDRIDLTRKFSTYLFEITKNLAISELRKHKPNISIDAIAEIAHDETVYDHLVTREQAKSVRAAVSTLPAKYRKAIELYYFHELSYEEVGARLRMPINTVRTHLKRAKTLLAQTLIHEKP